MTCEEENNEGAGETMLEQNEPKDIPRDKHHFVIMLFYALGTTTLIPANFFTTAIDYWMYKFRDPNNANFTFDNQHRTKLQAEFVSWYSIVANASNIMFLALNILAFRKLGNVKSVIAALCGIISMFALTCIFIPIDTDTWQLGFCVITLLTGFILTGFCATFMVTLFLMLAKFPTNYLAAMLSGTSLCGIFAALVQIFSLSIGTSSKITGLTYFGIGMFCVFLTLIGFIANVYWSEFFKYHVGKEEEQQTVKPKITKKMVWNLLKKLKYYLASMIIVLGSSIMIHPGVTSLVISVDKGNGKAWNEKYFVPAITFLTYFVFDYIGRECAGFLKKPKNGIVILIAGLCRIALVPMIMYCNAQPRSHLPVIFDKDFIYILFIIIFAFTNGYLVNLCVIQIPTVTKHEEKKLSMLLILIFMILSLGACSFLSAVVVKLL